MIFKASSRGVVSPFVVMDVMREANALEAAGKRILHLEVGQPATGAPKGVIKNISKLTKERLGYTEAFGLECLREQIAHFYLVNYGVEVPTGRIAITTGSSGGFVLSFLAAFDSGQRVGVSAPGYPAYRNILKSLGVEVVEILTDSSTNFQPTVDLLRNLDSPIDGLIIASPSNPTGTMIDADNLNMLSCFCEEREVRVISDEIYHGITYGKKAHTMLEFSDQAIVVNSFSKYFSMTGWRIGWCILPIELVRSFECLSQNLYISPPTLSQYAGIAAFDCIDELEQNVERYARNREVLLKELPKAGFNDLASVEGAFYIYANVKDIADNSSILCHNMLVETGVAATPGVDFDPTRGEHYIRFSFSGTTEEITEATQRLLEW